jgi:predicted dehydrogenase
VTAQRFSPADPRFRTAEADIVFTLEFPGGVLATGSASWSYRLQNRLRVGFERAWVDLEPASPVIGQVLRVAAGQGHEAEVQPLEQVDQLPLMFDHVADVVLDHVPTSIPASEGLLDLQILEAIYAAAASGATTPVEAGNLRGGGP